MKKAVVIGGTGATGRQLIQQLIKSDDYQTVISIGRRSVLDGFSHSKVSDIVIDSLAWLKETEDAWKE
ncbi:MAG: hypothetical protein CM15mP87_06540 [Candidatus Neomarinimicrobiota bacterium]|nr:MAG: hypothetical protein CM15mP87_06540 [Candidatus Neomarinimicrobiota bacterium]